MMKKKQAELVEETKNEAVSEEAEVKKKKPLRVLNTIINVVLVIAIIVAAICTYVSFVTTSGNGVPNIFGLRLLSIQTDSMYPELVSGDLIIGTDVEPADLRKGDIITYWTVINGERVLNTHRINEIFDGGGYLIFETKGDNNNSVDPLTVHESEVVGKYKMRIPGVGKVFNYLQTSTGFLVVVVIPVFIFFIYHLVQFFRVLFEYQNVKNRIKYEQERGRTEDMIAAHEEEKAQKEADRAAMEAEIREKLRAEILASMQKEQTAAAAENATNAAEEATPATAEEATSESNE